MAEITCSTTSGGYQVLIFDNLKLVYCGEAMARPPQFFLEKKTDAVSTLAYNLVYVGLFWVSSSKFDALFEINKIKPLKICTPSFFY